MSPLKTFVKCSPCLLLWWVLSHACVTVYFSENFIISCFDTLSNPLWKVGKMLLFPICQKTRKLIVLPKPPANVRIGARAPGGLASPMSLCQTWALLPRERPCQLDRNDMKTSRTILLNKSGFHSAQKRKHTWCRANALCQQTRSTS